MHGADRLDVEPGLTTNSAPASRHARASSADSTVRRGADQRAPLQSRSRKGADHAQGIRDGHRDLEHRDPAREQRVDRDGWRAPRGGAHDRDQPRGFDSSADSQLDSSLDPRSRALHRPHHLGERRHGGITRGRHRERAVRDAALRGPTEAPLSLRSRLTRSRRREESPPPTRSMISTPRCRNLVELYPGGS